MFFDRQRIWFQTKRLVQIAKPSDKKVPWYIELSSVNTFESLSLNTPTETEGKTEEV